MNSQQATTLATRLAEALELYVNDHVEVAEGGWADYGSAEMAGIILPLLHAQAEKDEDKCKVNKRLIVDFKNLHQTLIYRETELSALRALVGRMREELTEASKQKRLSEMNDDERHDGDFEYAYDQLVASVRRAIEEADKVAN